MKYQIAFSLVFALIICVKTDETNVKSCGLNEHITRCGSSCEGTCDNPFPNVCSRECVGNCTCDQGFVRKTKGGPCIAIESCLGTTPPNCGPNEEYKKCGPACPKVCLPGRVYVNEVCQGLCVEGCFCKKGFIRVKKGGICIPNGSCSKICRADQVYGSGSICPATCRYPDPICVTNWQFYTDTTGCFCDEGYVQDERGFCIPRSSCPPQKS